MERGTQLCNADQLGHWCPAANGLFAIEPAIISAVYSGLVLFRGFV